MRSSTARLTTALALLALTMLIVSGCNSAPEPDTSSVRHTETPNDVPLSKQVLGTLSADPQVAAALLIELEREGSRSSDQELLRALWDQDAEIIDGRNTADPGDDYRWSGIDAIMDRYMIAVFPVPPPAFPAPPEPELVSIEGDMASVVNGGDQWTLRQQNGRWYLLQLVYQQP